MTMTDDTALDGNAAAGVLDTLFRFEATTTIVTCASCGSTGPLGGAVVYMSDMGTVVRCRQCTAALIRAAELRDRIVVDLRGASSISVAVPG